MIYLQSGQGVECVSSALITGDGMLQDRKRDRLKVALSASSVHSGGAAELLRHYKSLTTQKRVARFIICWLFW